MTKKYEYPSMEDLVVFHTVVKKNSFSKAAIDLGYSKAYITKRISILEQKLKIKLFYRNTRNIKLTEEGEKAFNDTYLILFQMKEFISNINIEKNKINGVIHICSSYGFGRQKLSQAISLLKKQNPEINIKLTLTDLEIDLIKEDIDIKIHVGNTFKDTYYAKKLVPNCRILCASPKYLEQHPTPQVVEDLFDHNCLFIKEHNSLFGSWSLIRNDEIKTIKINGDLTSNSSEIIMNWARDGYGIVLRSHWDARQYLDSGELIHILPDWYEKADIWAIYPKKISESYKVEMVINFLEKYFQDHPL